MYEEVICKRWCGIVAGYPDCDSNNAAPHLLWCSYCQAVRAILPILVIVLLAVVPSHSQSHTVSLQTKTNVHFN